MNGRRALAFPVVLMVAFGLSVSPAWADSSFSRIAVIQVPGAPLRSFDISWVNNPSQTYYLADRSNARLDVVDARTNVLTQLGSGVFVGFTGNNDTSGPDGVVVIESLHQLWAGDGNSRVQVFDLKSGQLVDTISTAKGPGPNPNRADELTFDEKDHLIVIANDADTPPYLSFISTQDHSVVGRLDFPDATDGLEQPLWDRATHRIYQAVPETPTNPGGEVAVVDPETMAVTAVFPVVDCHPHGLALGPHQNLLLGCASPHRSIAMDARSGAILANITRVGGSDEVWFNPGDKNFYLAARNFPGGPVLGVIDAETNSWIANVPTGPGAHSVAANRANNHIFVPIAPKPTDPACLNGCIAVYAMAG